MRFGRVRATAAAGVGAIGLILAVLLAAGRIERVEALVIGCTVVVLLAVALADVRSQRRAARARAQLVGLRKQLRDQIRAEARDEIRAGFQQLDTNSIARTIDQRNERIVEGALAEQATLRQLAEETIRTVSARLSRIETAIDEAAARGATGSRGSTSGGDATPPG